MAPSTQNQALNALLFFFRYVLNKDLGDVQDALRAKSKRRLPVILTRAEVASLFVQMEGVPLTMAQILYGSGLRLFECVKLRIQHIDFERKTIMVFGKGDKTRETLLPDMVAPALKNQIDGLKKLFESDRRNDVPGVEMPYALEKKYPNAGKEFGWQWVFPSHKLSKDPRSEIIRRHHIHRGNLHKYIKTAVVKAGITKRVSSHGFSAMPLLRICLKMVMISALYRSYWGILQ